MKTIARKTNVQWKVVFWGELCDHNGLMEGDPCEVAFYHLVYPCINKYPSLNKIIISQLILKNGTDIILS
jgi:hypothetical protein